MIYLPILGAAALAGGTIIEKIILKNKKVAVKLYLVAGFLAVIIAMLPFVYFFWKLDSQAFALKNIIIFALIVIFSIIANLFFIISHQTLKPPSINIFCPVI